MNTFEQFKKNYKRDVLVRIIQALKNGSMTRDESRIFSRLLLSVYARGNERDVMHALSKLSQVREDFLDVYLRRGREYEASRNADTVSRVRENLKGYVEIYNATMSVA